MGMTETYVHAEYERLPVCQLQPHAAIPSMYMQHLLAILCRSTPEHAGQQACYTHSSWQKLSHNTSQCNDVLY
jgi:hypothetical protein